MPRKTKPKFKRWQVVYWKRETFDEKLDWYEGGLFAKIKSIVYSEFPAYGKPRWRYGVNGKWVDESNLRPLTKREKGD